MLVFISYIKIKNMKIVVDDKIPYIKGAFESMAEVVYLSGAAISKADLLDADALIIRTRTRCNADLLDDTSVKFIATATIGFDHIDTGYCASAGIEWTNAPGCNSGSVEQYFASILANLILIKGKSANALTVGIVGVGNVGKKIERFCKCVGIKVLLNDPPRQREEGSDAFVSLSEIAQKADIITFHTPLTMSGVDKTYHLLDDTFVSTLKKRPFIINACRGEVTDNVALKTALQAGKLSGAAIDCWENEPNIDLALLDLVDFATPHIAGYSKDGKANGTTMSVQAISRFFNLGIDNWTAQGVDLPEEPTLKLLDFGADDHLLPWKIILKTYDIQADTDRIRKSPDAFEYQRGNYPVRRENGSYTLTHGNQYNINRTLLACLGFNIL